MGLGREVLQGQRGSARSDHKIGGPDIIFEDWRKEGRKGGNNG
jgi:hypothetical protein